MEKVLTKKVNRNKFYEHYLLILNGILRLTDSELRIAAEFMSIYEFDMKFKTWLTEEEKQIQLFSTDSRKQVATSLNISIPNLNNYIKKIKDKNVFSERDGNIIINPNIYTVATNSTILFKLQINEQDPNQF